jgi:hypothetical protein
MLTNEREALFRSRLQGKGTNLARQRCPAYERSEQLKPSLPRTISCHNGKSDRSEESQEYSVGNNKNPNQKQAGEKEPGKFHYNPGNMSGKTADTKKDESKSESTADSGRGHPQPQDNKK